MGCSSSGPLSKLFLIVRPPFMMAAITKNRNIFNCPLLLKDQSSQIWFYLVQQFQRRRFKCDLSSKYAYLDYSDYMLNYSLPCIGICSYNLSSLNFRNPIENQVSDYRLLGASRFCLVLFYLSFSCVVCPVSTRRIQPD
jgi:hypothetical protein